MKKRIIVVLLILAMVVTLGGCAQISRPENVVKEIMKQENLIDYLTVVEESYDEEDNDIYTKYFIEILMIPSIKSLLLDNVRSLRYNISDVVTDDDRATVTAVITHFDISPVVDKAMENYSNKLSEMDSSALDNLETEEEMAEYLYPILIKSLKEAATKVSPTETYTKVKFECVRYLGLRWELDDWSDNFVSSVLLMNIAEALEHSSDGLGE